MVGHVFVIESDLYDQNTFVC